MRVAGAKPKGAEAKSLDPRVCGQNIGKNGVSDAIEFGSGVGRAVLLLANHCKYIIAMATRFSGSGCGLGGCGGRG